MVRALLVLSLALAACTHAIPGSRAPGPHELVAGPYVMLLSTTAALVAFRSVGRDDAVVEWKAGKAHGTGVVERKGDLYGAEITGLPTGDVIEYAVKIGTKEVGKGTFRSGLLPGETKFRFAVFGDTRTNHQVHRAVIDAVAKEKVDFYLHTGDMVEFGGDPDQWSMYFNIEGALMAKAPILPAIGNHDLGNRGYYNKFFFLDRRTKGNRYFVTDWGNVRLVALDLDIVCEQRCDQYEYVRSALEEGAKQNKLLVMFLHYPPYSSGAHGSNLELRAVMGKLAKTYGVELVITGHDHDYERTKSIDGTTYIVSGSAGAPIHPVRPHDFTAAARTEPHYVLVDVDGDQLSVRAVNLKGEVFDSVVIPPNPPQPGAL